MLSVRPKGRAGGFFSIEIYKDSKAKFKYTPRLVFGINLHVKDLPILLKFKGTLGVLIVSTKVKVTSYTVKTFKDLAVIVNHFKLYPLVWLSLAGLPDTGRTANILCINIGYKLILLWQQKNILIIKV